MLDISKVNLKELKFEMPNFRQPPEEGSHKWCSENAYMTALYHIIAVYSLTFLSLIAYLSVFVYAKCCRSDKSGEAAEGEGANEPVET